MDRRQFLATMTAASLLAPRFSWAADEKSGKRRVQHIGVQLYTVRDLMQRDFDGTLSKVRGAGYREVEFAGYYGHSPKDVRASIDRVGLTAPSNHVDYKTVTENWPQALDAAHIIGHKYLVNPMIDEAVRNQPGGWKKAAEAFNRAGEASKKAGIQFCYHNHWFDFYPLPDGKLPYDVLLANSDPQLVKLEMDLCWITVGGQDPVKYFDRYPGRFPLVHVKDLKKIPHPTASQGGKITFEQIYPLMTEVGSGVIDWKRIFSYSEKAGIKHYFVEHDMPKNPIESITKSYKYLANLRY
jgi:sugar phosphate isomerase/epimerase